MKEYKELDQDEKREYHRIYQQENRILKTYYWKFKNWRLKARLIEEHRLFTTNDILYIKRMNNKLLNNK